VKDYLKFLQMSERQQARENESVEVTSSKNPAPEDVRQSPDSAAPVSPSAPPQLALRFLRAEAEINAISQALRQTGWNRRRAAELLRISYRGLLYKIQQHNITAPAVSQLEPLTETTKVK